jgi:hypothetical protein
MTRGVLGELSRARADLQGSAPVFWFVLIGLVICTAWTAWRLAAGLAAAGRRRSVPVAAGRRLWADRTVAVLAAGFGVAWVIVDGWMEGPVLFVVTRRHGVTVSDLACVVAVAVAGAGLLQSATTAASIRVRDRQD